MFAPFAVIPDGPPLLWTPLRKLQAAVLRQARADLEQYAGHAIGREAERWFRDTDPVHPFSFESICESLRLSPSAVRDALDARRRRGVEPPPVTPDAPTPALSSVAVA